jgi:hypothetical protein
MLFVVLAIAIVSWAAVAAAGLTGSVGIGAFCIGASLSGLALLMLVVRRERKQREAESAAGEPVHIGARHPDYAASGHPSRDAPIHDDREVEREIMREERVLHSDTGPRAPDISRIRARETIGEGHFRAGRDRGSQK